MAYNDGCHIAAKCDGCVEDGLCPTQNKFGQYPEEAAVVNAVDKLKAAGYRRFTLAGWLTQQNGCPKVMIAKVVAETDKAYYVHDLSGRKQWLPKSQVKVD